jgi:uncharacterized protein (TIGR00369 family)
MNEAGLASSGWWQRQADPGWRKYLEIDDHVFSRLIRSAPRERVLPITQEIDAAAVPEGYVQFPFHEGFIGHNGPLYLKREGDALVLGAPVLLRHCNPMKIAHGGWLATLLDMALPICARAVQGGADHFLLTVSMTIDFLGSVPLGAWVEGRAQVLKQTKRMVFVQGLLCVGGTAVARGSGVFRIGPPAPGLNLEAFPESAGG